MEDRAEMERETAEWIVDEISNQKSDLPTYVVAGALMRVSVILAMEAAGPEKGPLMARQAVENVLHDLDHSCDNSTTMH